MDALALQFVPTAGVDDLTGHEEEQPSNSKRRHQLALFDLENDVHKSKTIHRMPPGIARDLAIYAEKSSESRDPLEWWDANKENLPFMYTISQYLFCIPATSVPSERVFSSAGLNVSDIRSRLLPGKVEKMMLIYEN
jgi:hypothetical protein